MQVFKTLHFSIWLDNTDLQCKLLAIMKGIILSLGKWKSNDKNVNMQNWILALCLVPLFGLSNSLTYKLDPENEALFTVSDNFLSVAYDTWLLYAADFSWVLKLWPKIKVNDVEISATPNSCN